MEVMHLMSTVTSLSLFLFLFFWIPLLFVHCWGMRDMTGMQAALTSVPSRLLWWHDRCPYGVIIHSIPLWCCVFWARLIISRRPQVTKPSPAKLYCWHNLIRVGFPSICIQAIFWTRPFFIHHTVLNWEHYKKALYFFLLCFFRVNLTQGLKGMLKLINSTWPCFGAFIVEFKTIHRLVWLHTCVMT